MQLGGSDQWGNITTGTELIRRKLGGEAYGLTCPLIRKADGTKFGKTEQGNIWLSPIYTPPYRFYQFWVNTSDEDAKSYIKIFTMLSREEIDTLIAEQESAPHLRPLQKRLAKELTVMIHSQADYEDAKYTSEYLFSKDATYEDLMSKDEETLWKIFCNVDHLYLRNANLLFENEEVNVVDFLVDRAQVFQSKSEIRKLIAGGGLSLNQRKVKDAAQILGKEDLIAGKYLLFRKGKTNFHLVVAE
jgi:tyrosyl-tRNA synthetase